MLKIDLNCDLGESYYENVIGNDTEIMPYISSCNIACGFHGGDSLTIQKTIDLAIKYGVSIGAHPSFPDLENFGRKYMKLSAEELAACLRYQIGVLYAVTKLRGGTLKHVKPHGALYNAASIDFDLAVQIGKVIKEIDENLVFLGMANSEMEKAANYLEIPFAKEVFADRNYTDDGFLVPRINKNAVITNEKSVLDRSLKMVLEQNIVTENKKNILLKPDSICVHGDTPNATKLVKELNLSLKKNNIKITAF